MHTRCDKGILRGSISTDIPVGAKVSERAFRKRLHKDISSQASGTNYISTLESYDNAPHYWTAGHEKERVFNKTKQAKRFVDAHIDRLTLASEIAPALEHDAEREIERRKTSFVKRRNDSRKKQDTVKPCLPSLQNHDVFVHEPCWSAALGKALVDHKCRRVDEEWKATLFIMENPDQRNTATSRRIKWAAALMGRPVCAPRVFIEQHVGPILTYKCALDVKRCLWVSENFQATHPCLLYLIVSIFHHYGMHNWKLIPSIDEYLMLKLKHAKDAMVIALVTKTESDDDQAAGATRHVYSPFRLLGFITNLDRTHSSIGIGTM